MSAFLFLFLRVLCVRIRGVGRGVFERRRWIVFFILVCVFEGSEYFYDYSAMVRIRNCGVGVMLFSNL